MNPYSHLPITISKTSNNAFAELNIPPILYKYRDSNKANNLTAITGPELFLTCPSAFEDKADCQIKTDASLLTTRERIQKAYDSLPNVIPGIERNPVKRLREAQRWGLKGPINNPIHTKKVLESANEKFIARMGVLSMTADSANLAMWESYAVQFTGFCLGFSSDTFSELSGGPAHYVKELPIFKGNEDTIHWMVNQVYVKHEVYSFEDEYRIYKFWPPNQPTIEQRKIRARPEQVVDVIIGYKAPPLIAELCRTHLPHIAVRTARPDGLGRVLIE